MSPQESTTRACAHRGDADARRENTLPAIRSAIAKDAAFVEIDVRLTADGDVVVLHDPTLERLWHDERSIESVPTAELARFGDADHRPPLLREVLAEFAATPSRLVIDMDDARFAAPAYEVVAASAIVVDWTVDEDRDLERAIRLGIDTVTTNRLDRLQALLAAGRAGSAA